jgi:signal peptidase
MSHNKNSLLGFRIYNIVTGSMVPKYVVGDVLLVKEVEAKDLNVGDDISYLGEIDTFKDKVVTHRIIEKNRTNEGKYTFVTQGIANSAADPEINEDQIYGRVVYKLIILSFISKLIANSSSKFLVFIIPVIIAAAVYLIKMRVASFKILKADEDDDYEIDFDNIDIDNLSEEELEALLADEDFDDEDDELDDLEEEELAKIMEEEKKSKIKRKK